MKKIVVSIFIVFIIMLVLTPQVYAKPSANIAINGPTSVKPGETITLTLNFSADYNWQEYGTSEGLMYVTGSVSFDTNNVTYVEDVLIYGNPHIIEPGVHTPGYYAYCVAPTKKTDGTSKVGELVKIKFKIEDDVVDNTVVSFKVRPSLTRMRQDKNTDPSNNEGRDFYDLDTTGGTLNVKVSNPTNSTNTPDKEEEKNTTNMKVSTEGNTNKTDSKNITSNNQISNNKATNNVADNSADKNSTSSQETNTEEIIDEINIIDDTDLATTSNELYEQETLLDVNTNIENVGLNETSFEGNNYILPIIIGVFAIGIGVVIILILLK